MKKQPRAQESVAKMPVRRKFPFIGAGWVIIGVSSVTIALCVAAGAKDVLKGRVALEQKQVPIKSSPARSTGQFNPADHKVDTALLDKYGVSATSPKVAAEIRKADGAQAAIEVDQRTGAQRAADAYEALNQGYIQPGNAPPQIEIVRRGLVPPGMSNEQAAILYNSLPNNLKMPYTPRPGSPEWLARATREPVDPTPVLPDGTTPVQARAASDAQLETYMRKRSGPGGIVPLHVDHNWLAERARRTSTGFVPNHQISLIAPEYGFDTGSIREMTDSSGNIVYQQSFDPYGSAVKLQGSGPAPDFGYNGYYVHLRSGLNLTLARAYAPSTMFPNSNLSFC